MQAGRVAALLVLLCAPVSLAHEKERPVTKVTNLLKDMIAQLEKEAQEDEDVYSQMGCWCETNDKAKTESIADAKSRIEKLTSEVEELTAKTAKLSTEISNLQKEVASSKQTVDMATGLRAKENAEFNVQEKDMLQSIASMKGAIVSISKHQKGAALLQDLDKDTIGIFKDVADSMHKHIDLIREAVTPKQRRILQALSVGQGAQYAPQSGEIFGILKAMKESFEANMAAAQKDEAAAKANFEELKQAKTEEITAGTEQIGAKTDEEASATEKLAGAKQDLEDTTITLAEDTKFLADVKDKCTNMDQEYEERTKTRQLEIAATSKALEYLSSDEAHELFTKTFNPSLLQERRESRWMQERRAAVTKFLDKAARQAQNPELSALATHARMDAFGNLKKTVQTMVDRLLKEKEDEVKHKDFCVEQFNENSRDTNLATQEHDDTAAKVEDLKVSVDALAKSLEQVKGEVAELYKQMKIAGEVREKANKEFQVSVADQRATQKLLSTALGILKGFYEKSALVQTGAVRQHGVQPAFKKYEKKNGGGVMGMMESIIKDAKEMEAEAVRDEETSQKAYEEFCLDTNTAIAEKQTSITNLSQEKGKMEGEMLDREVELDGIVQTLDQLSTELQDIKRSCDFLLKNWDIRTAARDQEIEALKQAIALFSGAKMSAMLQHLR